MRFLITGGCGFLGSNLAEAVLKRGHELAILDNLSRIGSERNLEWLKSIGEFRFVRAEVEDGAAVDRLIGEGKPDAVFHLAGQVAMTTSLENPKKDFLVNAMGTLNVLDAIRRLSPATALIYSSSNKVYGDLEWLDVAEEELRYVSPRFPRGFDETLPLQFCSPYGCSKGAADQYVLDHARMFGLRATVFRHSSIFGSRQFSSFDQGWIGWFMAEFMRRKQGQIPISTALTIAGSGKQVRDVLFSEDLVGCYFAALEKIDEIKGQVFNIGGGMENSVSLLELFAWLESHLDLKVLIERSAPRASDQKIFVADCSRATRSFGWKAKVGKEQALTRMLAWTQDHACGAR